MDCNEDDDLEKVWQNMEKGLLKATDEICGWTNGRPRHPETWWWNGDVKAKADRKRSKYQIWYKAKDSPNEKARIEYVKAKRMVKKAVTLAQQNEKQTARKAVSYKRR